MYFWFFAGNGHGFRNDFGAKYETLPDFSHSNTSHSIAWFVILSFVIHTYMQFISLHARTRLCSIYFDFVCFYFSNNKYIFSSVEMESEKPKIKRKTPPTKQKSRAAKLRFLELNFLLYDDSIFQVSYALFDLSAKSKFCWRSKKRRNVTHVLKK